jgi:hypothetical protein
MGSALVPLKGPVASQLHNSVLQRNVECKAYLLDAIHLVLAKRLQQCQTVTGADSDFDNPAKSIVLASGASIDEIFDFYA